MYGILKRVMQMAWPVMLSYVAVGMPCGVLAAQAGMTPLMCLVLSATFVSGSGQFMMSNLWLAGVPAPSIAASVAAISARFALYSASLAPHIKHASRAETLAVSATLTEEAYGISLEQLTSDPDWTCKYAFTLNIVLIATWAISVWAGSIIGSAVDIPTSLAGFVCTSLFTYLLFCQSASRGNVLAALVSAGTVAVLKAVGAAGVAVPVAAVAGVIIAVVAGVFTPVSADKGGE